MTTHNQHTPPAAGKAAHAPTPYVVRKQYRGNNFLPHYWDVCTVREEGAEAFLRTIGKWEGSQ